MSEERPGCQLPLPQSEQETGEQTTKRTTGSGGVFILEAGGDSHAQVWSAQPSSPSPQQANPNKLPIPQSVCPLPSPARALLHGSAREDRQPGHALGKGSGLKSPTRHVPEMSQKHGKAITPPQPCLSHGPAAAAAPPASSWASLSECATPAPGRRMQGGVGPGTEALPALCTVLTAKG